MATIGKLLVDLRLRTAKFSQGVGKANNRLKSLERSAMNARGALNGMVGAAAVAGLVALTRQSITSADALAKTADKLGITTDALQELRFAASQTGVDQRTLEMGLQRMTRRLSEAAMGTGEAKDAIAELGLDARELARQAPDEAFRKIADAMQLVPAQSDRVRLAFKLFDSEGVALVNTLRGGSEALEEYSRKARDMGLVVNEQLIRQSEDANDKLDILSRTISANLTSAVLALAPEVSALSELFADTARNAGLFFDTLRDIPVTELGKASKIANLGKTIERLKGQGGTLAGEDPVSARLRQAIEQRVQIQRALNRQRFGDSPALGGGGEVKSDIDAWVAWGRFVSEAQEKVAKSTKKATAAKREQKTAAQALVERLREEHATLGMTEDQLLRYEAAQAVAATGGAKHAQEINQLVEAIILERAALEEVEAGAEKLDATFKDTSENMSAYADEAARNIQDAFADFLFDPFDDGLDGMLNGFVRTVRRMGAELAAAKLAESVGLSGGKGGGLNIGKIAGLAANVAGFFGNTAAAVDLDLESQVFSPEAGLFAQGGVMTSKGRAPLRTYARGGVARSPQLAVFGEGSQPEAFVPLPDGKRIPVAMQGGGGVTINVHTPNAESFRQSRSKLAADISRSLAGSR